MSLIAEALSRLRAIPNLTIRQEEPLALHTRFGIGGPAAVFCATEDRASFVTALNAIQTLAVPQMVIGGGTNLVVADAGFLGVVLEFRGSRITADGPLLVVEAGAVLQDAVDRSIALGLKGLETMTGIPGSVGGAVYGNAGAYGHSIQEIVTRVDFVDNGEEHSFNNEECGFGYRHSRFKDRKDWVILATELRFTEADSAELANVAGEIRTIRDAKYPPTMKCAGSIFKNVFFADLPSATQAEVPTRVVREGKVPSAWFLEQVDAKGLRRGDIQVATYHANLIYNDGNGHSEDLVAVIEELKRRVRERFQFDIEEEVQYVGFDCAPVLS